MTKKQARRLVGRSIVAVDLDATIEGDGVRRTRMHSPTIVLDDGTKVRFVVEEHPDDGTKVRFVVEEHPDGGEYGIDIVLAKAHPDLGRECRPKEDALALERIREARAIARVT